MMISELLPLIYVGHPQIAHGTPVAPQIRLPGCGPTAGRRPRATAADRRNSNIASWSPRTGIK